MKLIIHLNLQLNSINVVHRCDEELEVNYSYCSDQSIIQDNQLSTIVIDKTHSISTPALHFDDNSIEDTVTNAQLPLIDRTMSSNYQVRFSDVINQ